MYVVGRHLKDSENCITTPDYTAAVVAAKVFFRHLKVPIRIWRNSKLSYIFYEGVIYDVKGWYPNIKNKGLFPWLGGLIYKFFRGIITLAKNKANIFKILS